MKNREIVTQSGNLTIRDTTVYVVENRDGSRWYVSEGGTTVNLTTWLIDEDTNIELLSDIDCFSVNEPIRCLEELELLCEDM